MQSNTEASSFHSVPVCLPILLLSHCQVGEAYLANTKPLHERGKFGTCVHIRTCRLRPEGAKVFSHGLCSLLPACASNAVKPSSFETPSTSMPPGRARPTASSCCFAWAATSPCHRSSCKRGRPSLRCLMNPASCIWWNCDTGMPILLKNIRLSP